MLTQLTVGVTPSMSHSQFLSPQSFMGTPCPPAPPVINIPSTKATASWVCSVLSTPVWPNTSVAFKQNCKPNFASAPAVLFVGSRGTKYLHLQGPVPGQRGRKGEQVRNVLEPSWCPVGHSELGSVVTTVWSRRPPTPWLGKRGRAQAAVDVWMCFTRSACPGQSFDVPRLLSGKWCYLKQAPGKLFSPE